jgi:hypothetical protein
MKRITSLLLVLAISFIWQQPLLAQQKTLKPVIKLKMDDGDGSNAAAVVWHPVQQKYYTTMVGNAIYAMAIFDVKGKSIEQNIEAEFDYRGMWYNTTSKRIEFNCYDSGGIGHIILDKMGKILNKLSDITGMYQPDGQAVGTYYKPENAIIYLSSDFLVKKYDAKTGALLGTLIEIMPGCKTKNEYNMLDADSLLLRAEDRCMNSVQYTGIAGAELAVLNVAARKVELYNAATGLISNKSFKIPELVTIHNNFNFSYTNGIWWFFNKEEREWVGCK